MSVSHRDTACLPYLSRPSVGPAGATRRVFAPLARPRGVCPLKTPTGTGP